MLRSSLCLLFMATVVSVACAQGQNDVQSLQYEFGRGVSSVSHAPVKYTSCGCCTPVYPTCYNSCYVPRCTSRCYYPAPRVYYRRACVRPMYASPYYCW